MSRPLPIRKGLLFEADRRRSKYGSEAVLTFDKDGQRIRIHSKREAKRWTELLLLERAGKISQLERQVAFTFPIGEGVLTYVGSNRKVRFVLDFRYIDNESGELVHEDSKGVRTEAYKLKQALMDCVHGIEVLEV